MTPDYTTEELTEALRAINSIIHKCEKAQEKFTDGNSHHTLLKNRLKAMYISKSLIEKALANAPQTAVSTSDCNAEQFLLNLEQLHTTDLGVDRIKKNLQLGVEDVVGWCKQKIESPNIRIARRGKNWYVDADGYEITVNAYSYTIITVHKKS